MDNREKVSYKKEVGPEVFIFLGLFLGFFIYVGSIMGGANMLNTMMLTAYKLLIDVCFYLMAVCVIAGGISGLFSEFGVIAFINKGLSVVMKPIYDLPGAASLGILNCFMSDNPSILALAHDSNFRRYFKKYQLPALTNLGTSFGMGLIVTTTMVGLPLADAPKAALVGLLGAIVGSIVSVRLMIRSTKAYYGDVEMVEVTGKDIVPEGMRVVREGSGGGRFIQSLLDGGKVGVDMGMSIIPGVLLICTLVLMLTNGPGPDGLYDGSANQGIGLLPLLGEKINFIIKPLFGFSSPEAVAVPITALGSSGAAIAMVTDLVGAGKAYGNDIAVFTSICMCWSGYLSTHIAMMDALDTKEMTGKAIFSHTIGGLCGGIAAHFIYMLLA
ncbi:MAG: hypothetical protein Q4E36_00540 [Bacillota bacterium]|nr:hypothetical protein [Bacillota bacterium]